MPILKEEKSIFPEGLFDKNYLSARRDSNARWWAVYTLSRREKDFMRRLIPHQVPFFCPILRVQKRSPNGRVRTTFTPLFANYVFIYATEAERDWAFKTNCISRCLVVNDEERLVFDLAQISQLMRAKQDLRFESQLKPGTPVRIKSGPMEGIEGFVIETRSESRLLVTVNYLQQGTSLEIKDFEVEKM